MLPSSLPRLLARNLSLAAIPFLFLNFSLRLETGVYTFLGAGAAELAGPRRGGAAAKLH